MVIAAAQSVSHTTRSENASTVFAFSGEVTLQPGDELTVTLSRP
jgi:hypothetical protein